MRINKFLEGCGVGSRRFCDTLISDGKVTVNGKKAVLGQEVDERRDSVVYGGKRLNLVNKNSYYIDSTCDESTYNYR